MVNKTKKARNVRKIKIHIFEIQDQLSPYFPGGSNGQVSAYNMRDPGSIPGSGRSPAEGSGNPLQYSCLENPMDRGTW